MIDVPGLSWGYTGLYMAQYFALLCYILKYIIKLYILLLQCGSDLSRNTELPTAQGESAAFPTARADRGLRGVCLRGSPHPCITHKGVIH